MGKTDGGNDTQGDVGVGVAKDDASRTQQGDVPGDEYRRKIRRKVRRYPNYDRLQG